MKSRKNIRYKKNIKKGGVLSVGIKARIDMGFKKNPNFDLNEILRDYDNDNKHKEILDYAIKKGYINMDRIQGLNNSLLHHILSRSIKNPKNIKKTTETSRKIKSIVKNYKIQDRSIYNNIRNFEKKKTIEKKKFINWFKDKFPVRECIVLIKYNIKPNLNANLVEENLNNISITAAIYYNDTNGDRPLWSIINFDDKMEWDVIFRSDMDITKFHKNSSSLLNYFNLDYHENSDLIQPLQNLANESQIQKLRENELINKLISTNNNNLREKDLKAINNDSFKQAGILVAKKIGFKILQI